jgi:O-antigen ligase
LGGILSLPSTRSKLNEFIFFKGVYHPFTPRLIQWQCCIDIVNENNAWVQGVGTGDVKPLLQACYQRKKFWGELYHYNSHNEYLEELLRHGLVGLTLLLMALGIPLILTIKRRQYLYSCFLIVFMFACLSEAILNRQKGVIFYAFFNSVLFMSSFSEKKNDLVIIDSKYSKKI